MDEVFIGEIAIVAFNFAPRNWAFCNGQIMAIQQNTALFSLLGTTYGGDGRTTFALPDLRGRVPVSSGQGPGLGNYALGHLAGVEGVTLAQAQLPAHAHQPRCVNGAGNAPSPVGAVWAATTTGLALYRTQGNPSAAMAGAAIGTAGGNQPHDNRQPYLALNYVIALQGIFPSRS